MNSESIVSVAWLSEHQHDASIRIVDASWHLPTAGRSGRAEYLSAHIPGAVYFDIDECSADSDLPHMLPSAEEFARYVGGSGITEQHHVIVYDTNGIFSAARVWWMFRYFGCEKVSVLNGGLPAWNVAGYPLEAGEATPEPSTFLPSIDPGRRQRQVVTAEQVLSASNEGKARIIDARSAARFNAVEKEFRPGLRSGHIPGSCNMPFASLLRDGFLKNDDELKTLFEGTSVLPDTPVITSCGSGVTAAVLCLALERIGVKNISLYDGSWSEWGGLEAMPVEPSSEV